MIFKYKLKLKIMKAQIEIIEKFFKKCHLFYKNLKPIDYNKTVIDYYSINIFLNNGSKKDNDKDNKKRENIIGAVINEKIPPEYYKYSFRWKNLRKGIFDYLKLLNKDKGFNKIECLHKGGRRNHYDFVIKVDDKNYNIEFKFNASHIQDSPQFISPMKPSKYLTISYEEYYYDNYLGDLAKEFSLALPDRKTYLENIHSTEPKCLELFQKKYYRGCPQSSKYSSENEDILFYQKAKLVSKNSISSFIEKADLDIKKLSEYLKSSQKDKIYMLYRDNQFFIDYHNLDYYEIESFEKVPDKSIFKAKTKTGRYLKILLRWKNGNGIAYPAFQIS